MSQTQPKRVLQESPILNLGSLDVCPTGITADEVRTLLVKGINAQQLREVATAIDELPDQTASHDLKQQARSGIATCRQISRKTQEEETCLLEALRDSGIEARSCSSKNDSDSLQIHAMAISISSKELVSAVAIARKKGFEPWSPKSPGGLECVRRFRTSEILLKHGVDTIRVELRWDNEDDACIAPSRFQPTNSDFSLLSLPRFLWPIYYLIRPTRAAFNKIFSNRGRSSTWPYLGTPDSLIHPLLEITDLSEEDLLVDLGCGDGRILIEAARNYGCRGLGIELDLGLAESAREKVTAESLQSQIRIEQGDMAGIDLTGATVVFLFLPIRSIPSLLDKLRTQLPSGAKVIAHEQDPIDPSLNPSQSIPIFTSTAITVAHVWIID